MVSVQEEQGSPLSAAQSSGLHDIDSGQTITFKKYRRTVLPLDGYIFWVATGDSQSVEGSLHINTQSLQDVSENYDLGLVKFTCTTEIASFYDRDRTFIWVGDLGNARFVIGSHSFQYEQAGLYHYEGRTLTPVFAAQFIDDISAINVEELIVSNSLPFFMSLPYDTSPALDWCPWPENVPVFPSYCVPENQSPPYVAIHNDPETIKETSLSMVNSYTGSDSQIIKETVSLSLYGLTNLQAANIRNYILHWALLHPEKFGVVNNPFIRDENRLCQKLVH